MIRSCKQNRFALRISTTIFVIVGIAGIVGCGQTPIRGSDSTQERSSAVKKEQDKISSAMREPSGNGLELFNALLSRYGRAKTYQSVSTVKYVTDGQESNPILSERVVFFATPNKHRVTTIAGDLVSTSISDGIILGEYNSTAAELLQSAPTMAEQNSTMISNFNFCGSLLYDFFSGPSRMSIILDSGGTPIRKQATDKAGIVLLSFKARAPYGTTEMKVDERTSEILEISSLMEPVVSQSAGVEEKFKLKSILLKETFSKTKFDAPIKEEAFKFDPPSNLEVRDRREEQSSLNLQKGVPAPEFTLKEPSGKDLTLTSLRGQVVMLDFWSPKIDPCRETIPYTLELKKRFASRGFTSYTITNEDPELVQIALRELGVVGIITLNDIGKKVQELYKVVQLPTYVFIDRQGRVSSVLVGKQDTKQLQIQLKRAGLNLD